MGFKLHRYNNFSLEESLSFSGQEFMPKDIEDGADFSTDELKTLKSASLVEYALEEGGHIMQRVTVKDTVYSAYLATKNNALWLMTNDDYGRNEDFNFIEFDQDLEYPYLVVEIRPEHEPRKTFLLDPKNLSLTMRDDPKFSFEDSDAAGDQFEILKEWPKEIAACLTEYVFDKLHIKMHKDEITFTTNEVILNDEEGDMSEAFGDSKESVKNILRGDGYQYFEYDNDSFKDQYDNAYKMLDAENLKEVIKDYNISSLEQFNYLLEEENESAEELKNRLIRAYCKAQGDIDQAKCREHIINTIESQLGCKYISGSFHFTYGDFGKYVPRLSVYNASISDLFKKGDVNFQFNDHYYGTIDEGFFNEEFVETKE